MSKQISGDIAAPASTSIGRWKQRKRREKAVKPPKQQTPKKRGPKPKSADPVLQKIITEINQRSSNDPAYRAWIQKELADQRIMLQDAAVAEKEILKKKPPSITKELWFSRVLDDGPDPEDAALPPPKSKKLQDRIHINERRFIRNRKKIEQRWNRAMKQVQQTRIKGGKGFKAKMEQAALDVMELNRSLLRISSDAGVARKIHREWERASTATRQTDEPATLTRRGSPDIARPSVRTLTRWVEEFRNRA